jgi:hypothetical protein
VPGARCKGGGLLGDADVTSCVSRWRILAHVSVRPSISAAHISAVVEPALGTTRTASGGAASTSEEATMPPLYRP